MRFEIPTSAVEVGGVLHDFYYNLFIGRSDLVRTVNDGMITVTGELVLSLGDIYNITEYGGNIFEYLAAIKCNIGLLGLDIVPDLPKRETLDENAAVVIKKFQNWFEVNSTMYLKDDNLEIFFLTNPFGNSQTEYLTGLELRTLTAIPGYDVGIYTLEQFNDQVSSGWSLVTLN